MTRRLLMLGVALAIIPAAALAQTPDPDIPLQTVKVGTRTFTVDPFYIVNCFPTEGTQRLADVGNDLEGEFQVQCFIRIGDTMTAIDEFPTSDAGVMQQVDVGQAIISAPQVEVDRLDGTVQP